MNPKNAPCKGCVDRHTACHDHCGKYAKWKEEYRKASAAEKEYNRKRREDYLMSDECERKKEKWRLNKKYGW